MLLTQDILDLADGFFDQLRAHGASEKLIADLAMTLVRHADRSVALIPWSSTPLPVILLWTMLSRLCDEFPTMSCVK